MIKYELTQEDFFHFNKYYKKHNASYFSRYMRYYFMFILVAIIYGCQDLFFNKNMYKNFDIFSLIPIITTLAIIFYLSRMSFTANYFEKRFLKNNPGVLGPVEINPTEDKLIMEKGSIKSEYGYDSFLGLVEDGDYYYIFIFKSSGIIIPKRALSDSADEMMLKNKIKPLKGK